MKKLVLHRDPSTDNSWTLTHVNASSTCTMNGRLFVLDGDSCDEYRLKPLLTTTCIPTVQGTGGVTINGKKLVLDGDPLSCGDNIIGTGPAAL
jgi:uncharacterized Zn-binding protein involved in type VI secretion